MVVLHLFDYYLPSTLSWVHALLEEMEGVQVEVGAPWIVRGEYFSPQFRYHVSPMQRWLAPRVVSEWQYPRLRHFLTASQRFVPSYAAWLWRRLKADPPDLLHAHFGPTGCLYLPLARRLRRPLVVTFYGYDYTRVIRQRPVYRQRYRELFAGAAALVAASDFGAQLLRDLGCPSEKLRVVSPSVSPASFPVVENRRRAGPLRLVQVATFTAKKGHLIALEAFRQALPDCPGLHLTLAGEVADRSVAQQVRQFIQRYGLGDHVSQRGFVAHGDVPGFLAGFDVFIHPSRHTADGDHEDTPVAVLEAQASGLPVLATRHAALPEMVLHGHTGFLVPEGDAAALAVYIRQLNRMDPADYRRFSLAARAHTASNYALADSAKRLISVYKELNNWTGLT